MESKATAPPKPPRYHFFIAGCAALGLLGLAHLGGYLGGTPPPANADEETLFRLLETYKVNLMGSMRSTRDLLNGFSLFFSLAPWSLAAIGLIAATTPGHSPILMRRLALAYSVSTAAFLVNSIVHWFVAPTSLIALCFALFVVSLLVDGKEHSPPHQPSS